MCLVSPMFVVEPARAYVLGPILDIPPPTHYDPPPWRRKQWGFDARGAFSIARTVPCLKKTDMVLYLIPCIFASFDTRDGHVCTFSPAHFLQFAASFADTARPGTP
eukprot:gene10916-biopygen18347